MSDAVITNRRVFLIFQFCKLIACSSIGLIAVMDCTVIDLMQDIVRLRRGALAYTATVAVFLFIGTIGRPVMRTLERLTLPREWKRLSSLPDTGASFQCHTTAGWEIASVIGILVFSIAFFAGLVADGVAAWNGPPIFSVAFLLGGTLAVATAPSEITVRGDRIEFNHWFGSWSLRMSDDTQLRLVPFGGSVQLAISHRFLYLQFRIRDQAVTENGEEVSVQKAFGQLFRSGR